MNSARFKELYDSLNPAQREAVDAIEGPVMVVAGPGTGKTQILTLRIANILKKTDATPDNILALTFTESGAISMRRRLVEIIGSAGYSVVISTFHGFCNDIIKSHPEEFPRIIGSESITEIDQFKIIEEAVSRLSLKELKPFGNPLYYVGNIVSSINQLKREGVNPDDLAAIVKCEKQEVLSLPDLKHKKGAHKGKIKGEHQKTLDDLKRSEELVKIYKNYEAELLRKRLYDYTDMLMEVMRELKENKDLLLALQERYQYILVDEHQDTNNVQNKIIELLGNFHDNPNIFVVGDEKQAIFRFQGASVENFIYFQKLYPAAKLVVLEENYRSTAAILESAHSVIPGKKKLRSNKHAGESVSVYGFSKPDAESYFVAEDIKKRLATGINAGEIAVIYRDNRDALPIMRFLEKSGVPFTVESEENALSDNDIKKFILLLRAAHDFGSAERVLEAMHIDFLHIEPLDVYRLAEVSSLKEELTFSLMRSVEKLEEAGIKEPEKIYSFYKLLSSWVSASKNKSLLEFLEVVSRESGIIEHILQLPDRVDKMEKLNAFFDEVKNLVERHRDYGLPELIEYLDALKEHNIAVKKTGSHADHNRVRLMTAHRSKGQEFEEVYIINAYDGHWGNRRARSGLKLPSSAFSLSGKMFEQNDNDDERRLFYVALTRAKNSVTITYSKTGISGREQLPSQFIGEIKPEFLKEGDGASHEKHFEENRQVALTAAEKINYDIKDKAFVRELFLRHGLSVTALNNYLRCPWEYFYQNLLRIPGAPDRTQMYGIAIHATLKWFFDEFGKHEDVSPKDIPAKDALLAKFEFFLKKQPMEKGDLKESLMKGKKALGGWYERYKYEWVRPVLNEFSIRGIVLSPEITLTGKIDKIEIIAVTPGQPFEVNVVDYKTSKPKTRNEIEGLTKSSEGDIKRQLIFYNLLLSKYDDGKKFKMISGEIDFIEPENGKYKKEKFDVQPDEVVKLEGLIREKAKEILDLAFWDSRCGREECKFCEWREAMV